MQGGCRLLIKESALGFHAMKKKRRASRLALVMLKARVPEYKASRRAGWINIEVIICRSVEIA